MHGYTAIMVDPFTEVNITEFHAKAYGHKNLFRAYLDTVMCMTQAGNIFLRFSLKFHDNYD